MNKKDKTTENINASLLLDFYGKLLTKKSLEITELYYNEDISITEISENMKISRQAVHDSLKRSVTSLEKYEEKLGLVKRFQSDRKVFSEALEYIKNNDIENAKEKINMILDRL